MCFEHEEREKSSDKIRSYTLKLNFPRHTNNTFLKGKTQYYLAYSVKELFT